MRFLSFPSLLMAALAAACGDEADRLGVGPSNAAPTAGFTAQCNRLACAFTNGSGDADGTIESYDWDFGDQSDHATGRDAARTYAAPGSYIVRLVVTDNDGASTTAARPVQVSDPNFAPTADFTFLCDGLSCAFTDGSREGSDGEPLTAYSWAFGDGTASSDANPEHVYASEGFYPVTLTVTDGGGLMGSVVKQLTAGVLIYEGTGSRYLLLEDGTFALQYLDSTAVRFEFPGRYSSTNASLWFTFDGDTRWWATGTIHGDSLIVKYNVLMQLDGFEDAVYLRVAPTPQVVASRYRF